MTPFGAKLNESVAVTILISFELNLILSIITYFSIFNC